MTVECRLISYFLNIHQHIIFGMHFLERIVKSWLWIRKLRDHCVQGSLWGLTDGGQSPLKLYILKCLKSIKRFAGVWEDTDGDSHFCFNFRWLYRSCFMCSHWLMSPALTLAGSPDGEAANLKTYFSNQDKLEGECLLPLFWGCSIRMCQLFFSWKNELGHKSSIANIATECLKCFKGVLCRLADNSLQCACARNRWQSLVNMYLN